MSTLQTHETRTDAIMALARTGLNDRAIADRLSLKLSQVQSLRYYALHRRAESQRRHIPDDVFDRLVPAAKRRGMSVWLLAKSILDAVVNDNLIDVVLSDGAELAEIERALAAHGGG